MNTYTAPQPLNKKFLTPGVMVLIVLAINGLAFALARILFGIGAVTHLNNQYPWGLWIGVDVAAGVALAAGGFTSAALGHVMHREDYQAIGTASPADRDAGIHVCGTRSCDRHRALVLRLAPTYHVEWKLSFV